MFRSYLAILLCYVILDGIWLGLIAQESYQQALGGFLREQYPVAPWAIFYLLYAFVILELVVNVKPHGATSRVLWRGCLLGLAAYGAYNLTNYAILAGWPLDITIKDWLWGTFVTTASGLVGFVVLTRQRPGPS